MNKLKKKRKGNLMILMYFIMLIGTFFLCYILDMGVAFSTKAKMQNIADSASISAMEYGKKGEIRNGVKYAYIDEDEAKYMADKIVRANSTDLNMNSKITKVTYNPSGATRYYEGYLEVQVDGETESILKFFGNNKYTFTNKAETQVKPK